MINVSHLTFSYGRHGASVLDDFSLELSPGGIYGLLGKNGTGKSTLLYLLCGLLRPTAGRVTFEGYDMTRRCPEALSEIFIVPEEFELPDIKMSEYVALYRPFYPRFSDEILAQCLADFGLSTDIRFGGLSMGQKKKAYMSFALAVGTRLLLMDEPTNGLDIPSKSVFRRVVSRCMTDDRTIIISTHQVRDVEMLLDHLVIIDRHRLLLNASTGDVCAALRFEQRTPDAPTEDALYVQSSIRGNSVITPMEGEGESSLDLELLFNAVIAHPEIAGIIHA